MIFFVYLSLIRNIETLSLSYFRSEKKRKTSFSFAFLSLIRNFAHLIIEFVCLTWANNSELYCDNPYDEEAVFSYSLLFRGLREQRGTIVYGYSLG